MKPKKSWTIATAAAVLLAAASLAGCSKGGISGGQTAAQSASSADGSVKSDSEPIEASMYVMSPAASADHFITSKLLQDRFHIRMKWILNPLAGFFDKLNVMIASGELPDLIAPLPIDQAKDIGPKGALVPLNRYMDQMPNLRALLDKDKMTYASSVASDGNIYAVPTFDMKENFRYVPTIRGDLLAETGLPAPATFDDLYRVLKAIKQKHPDSLGIVNMDKAEALNDFGYNFHTRSGIFFDETKDQWVFGPMNEGFKEMIGFFHQLWNDKLLDPEFFTASQQQWEIKVLSGQAAFWLSWPENAYKYTNEYRELHPDSKFVMNLMMPMTTRSYGKKVIQGQFRTNTWTTIAVSSKAQHIDRLLKLIDWMYSDEGSTALQFGIEGQTYTSIDGKKKFADSIQAGYNKGGQINPSALGIGSSGNLLLRVIRDDEYQGASEFQKAAEDTLDTYRKNNYYQLNNNGISLTFTDDQLSEKETLGTDLNTFVTESSIRFITGEKSLTEYESFLNELQSRGAKRLEAIYNQAYAKYKETRAKIG